MNTFLLDIDMSVLNKEYLGVTLTHYLWALGIVIFTVLLKKTLTSVVMRISSRIVSGSAYAEHREKIKGTLFRPLQRLLQIVLYNLAANQFNERFDKIRIYHSAGQKVVVTLSDAVDHAFLLLFIIYLAQSIGGLIELVHFLRLKTAREENNHGRQQLLPLMKEVSKLLLWTLCTFWILGSVFHVNVPALITGLGIGGVAIALAGKATVENFFAAFTLLSDKPFQVGDVIKLGDLEGSVEQIGFRSTHLRLADGSLSIIPNQSLVSQNLINMSSRNMVGVKLVANISYGADPEKLQLMAEDIKATLKEMAPVMEPIFVVLDKLEKETIQVTITYHLAHPLPEGLLLPNLKHMVHVKIYETLAKYTRLGAALQIPS